MAVQRAAWVAFYGSDVSMEGPAGEFFFGVGQVLDGRPLADVTAPSLGNRGKERMQIAYSEM